MGNVEHSRNRPNRELLGGVQDTNSLGLLLRQFRSVVRLAMCSAMSKHMISMVLLPRFRDVFKVVCRSISSIPVLVIDLMTGRCWSEKCASHEAVNGPRPLSPIERQGGNAIASLWYPRSEYDAPSRNASAIDSRQTPKASTITHFVDAMITINWQPHFIIHSDNYRIGRWSMQ